MLKKVFNLSTESHAQAEKHSGLRRLQYALIFISKAVDAICGKERLPSFPEFAIFWRIDVNVLDFAIFSG